MRQYQSKSQYAPFFERTAEEDPWYVILSQINGDTILNNEIAVLLNLRRLGVSEGTRIAELMRHLGWVGPHYVCGRRGRGYVRA